MAPVESLTFLFKKTKVQTCPTGNFSPAHKSPNRPHQTKVSIYWQSSCKHLSCHLSISLWMQSPDPNDGCCSWWNSVGELRITIFHHNIKNLWSGSRMHTYNIIPTQLELQSSRIYNLSVLILGLKRDIKKKKKNFRSRDRALRELQSLSSGSSQEAESANSVQPKPSFRCRDSTTSTYVIACKFYTSRSSFKSSLTSAVRIYSGWALQVLWYVYILSHRGSHSTNNYCVLLEFIRLLKTDIMQMEK